MPQFVEQTFTEGQVLGADPQLLTRPVANNLEQALARKGAKLKLIPTNLVDKLWKDQPSLSQAPIEVHPKRFAGETVAAKLRRLRREMARKSADAHVLTTLDAIAWLFNIRSRDVEYNPFAIAYAVVTRDRAMLYTDPQKITSKVRKALEAQVELLPYSAIGRELSQLKREKAGVWVDGESVNLWVLQKIKSNKLIDGPSPVSLMKARKNKTEIEGARAAHLRDGVAMVKFLCWLERAVSNESLNELSVGRKVAQFRAAGEHFRGESFGIIVGYNQHGAIIHYQATEKSALELRPEGLLLIDSGGQYVDGTTDITRTVLLGEEATEAQREHFTRVLKGHIAIARCRFPAGTAGRQIDVLARQSLWNVGLNYNHGTGHGVGSYLSVHEGPQSISPIRCTGVPLEVGNVLSNEPGYYQEGEYGIRIENLVLVREDEELSTKAKPFLSFETLTLCPIDVRLVQRSLLTTSELDWLNQYHQRVHDTLIDKLKPTEADWLRRATKQL